MVSNNLLTQKKGGGRGVGVVEKGGKKGGQSDKGFEKGVSLLKRTCKETIIWLNI